MDRATPPACGRPGSARFAARVRQRGECPVPGAALPLEGRSARDRRGKAARRMAARARAGGNAADRPCASRFGVVVPPSGHRTAPGTGGGMALEGGYSNAPGHRRGPTETLGKLQPPWHDSAELAHHTGPDAGSSTMSSSTSWCISCTAATAVTTGRRSDGLCRTTSGAERNCGSAEPGWRGRNNSGFLLQRGH